MRLPVRIPALILIALCFCFSAPAAQIIIVNLDGAGEGLNDPTPAAPIGGNPGTTIGQQRLNVFQRAAEFWGARLVSGVPIRVAAQFNSLSCTVNSGTLGSAGPISLFRDFAGAPKPATYYPSALANALAGADLAPTEDDITATFNSDVGKSGCLTTLSWYYGFDHNLPANGIDFLDTVLHEFAHGLGFLCTVDLASGMKFNGFDDTFMKQLEDHRSLKLYPDMTDAERASASLATGNLHWVGSNVLAMIGILSAGTSGGHVRMYAPSPNQPGSSVSHWDTVLSPDELLEPYATPTADPRLTVESMKDIGWKLAPGTPQIVSDGVALIAENCGFGNSAIDPGETVTVSFTLRNSGTANATNLVASLLTGSGVSSASPAQSYGALLANGPSFSRSFSLSATGLCGTTLSARLQLFDGANNLGIVSFPFKLGTTASLTNNTAISVPASGSGSPYPSTLTLSNQPISIHGLVVQLLGVTHSNPDDLDILLVGPGAQSVMLMSDAGGPVDINNVNLTFDDNAAASLPDSTQILSGAYKPTDYQTGDTFPAPAPAGPYGTSLAVFDGTNPNGAWRLFVRDDTSPRSGSIAGWSLTFPSCCSGELGPSLTLSTGTVTYVENGAPVTVDPAAIANSASGDFNAGNLSLQIPTNGTWSDILFIQNQGNSAGQIGVAGDTVSFGGASFGTFTTNPGPALTISFTSSNVTTNAVKALIRAIQFRIDSDDPGNLSRTVQFTLSNGRAAAPAVGIRMVRVTPINDPPVLATIFDQTIAAGQTLTFSASATDVDSPQSALRFTLAVGAPTGASINFTNGLFTWTPTAAQAPSTNPVSIIVNDNGAPNLSATQSFKIFIQPGNHPPVLSTIPNLAVHQGATVTFTSQATDPDSANVLAFSSTNSPAGAALDPNTGVFSWTPSPLQTPSTNSIRIAVSDNGAPSLSDSKLFSIVVQPPPRIEVISLTATNLTLQWTAITGVVYRVQFRTNLIDSTWTDLPQTITSTGSTATHGDALLTDQQRFYRIDVLR